MAFPFQSKRHAYHGKQLAKRDSRRRNRFLSLESLENRQLLATLTPAQLPFVATLQAVCQTENQEIVYYEDFEQGLNGFTADNTGGTLPGLWHHSLGRSADGQPNHSPISSMYYGLFETAFGLGRYDTLPFDHEGTIFTPKIDLPLGVNTLHFNYFLATRLPTDVDFVEVFVLDTSTAGAAPVQVLSRAAGDLKQTGTTWEVACAEIPAAFSGKPVQILFRFDTGNVVNIDPEGWYVDDVLITNLSTADLSVTKTVDDGTPNEGQEITFTLTATNSPTSQGSANEVKVTDILPAGMQFVSSNPTEGSYDNTTGVWSGITLNPGESQSLEIVVTIASGTAGQTLINGVKIEAREPDPNPNDNETELPVPVNAADLSITKIVDDDTPNVGQTITYTLIATNAVSSNVTATGATVIDTLPTGVTFVSANPSEGTFDLLTGWTGLTLAPGESQTLELMVTVNAGTSGQSLLNTATIDGNETDPVPTNNTVTQTSIVNRVDVQVVKIANDTTPNEGQEVTFTITVTNLPSSNAPATNVVVTDLLPVGFTPVFANPTTWNIPALPIGASETLILVATLDAGTCGDELVNVVIVEADETDPDETNNRDELSSLVNCVDVIVEKTSSQTSYNQLEEVSFTISVSNASSSNSIATDIQLKDTLPSGLTFVSADQGGIYDPITRKIAWPTIASLPIGDSLNFTMLATVNNGTAGQTLTNVAEAIATETDPDPSNNRDEWEITVNHSVDLQARKTSSRSSAMPGDVVTFTITAETLTGATTAATGVTIVDTLPAGLQFLSATANGVYNSLNNTVTWTLPTLATGATETFSVTVLVGQTAAGKLLENVVVVAAAQTDPNPTNNRGTSLLAVGDSVQFIAPLSVYRVNGVLPPGALVPQPIPTPDAGKGTISGVFWHDVNQNGAWDNGEVTRAGWRFYIDLNGDNLFDPQLEPSSTTDTNGRYVFANLTPGEYTIRQDETQFSAGQFVVQTPSPDAANRGIGGGRIGLGEYRLTLAADQTISGSPLATESPNFGSFEYSPFIRPADQFEPRLNPELAAALAPWQEFTIDNTTDLPMTIESVTADEVTIDGTNYQLVSVNHVSASGVSTPVSGTVAITVAPKSSAKFRAFYDPAVRTGANKQTVVKQFPEWQGIDADATKKTPPHTFTNEQIHVRAKTDAADVNFSVALAGGSTFDSDIFYDGAVTLLDFNRLQQLFQRLPLNSRFVIEAGSPLFDPTSDINAKCPNGAQQVVGSCSWELAGTPTREIGLGDYGPLNVEIERRGGSPVDRSARAPLLDLDANNSSNAIGFHFFANSSETLIPLTDGDGRVANESQRVLTRMEFKLQSDHAADSLVADTSQNPNTSLNGDIITIERQGNNGQPLDVSRIQVSGLNSKALTLTPFDDPLTQENEALRVTLNDYLLVLNDVIRLESGGFDASDTATARIATVEVTMFGSASVTGGRGFTHLGSATEAQGNTAIATIVIAKPSASNGSQTQALAASRQGEMADLAIAELSESEPDDLISSEIDHSDELLAVAPMIEYSKDDSDHEEAIDEALREIVLFA